MSSSMQELRDKLNEFLNNAKTGNIIPIRLPGQIEEIITLVDAVEEEQKEAAAKAMPPDMEEYFKEEAYFVGHAVHELRTPMTPIRGYVDMLVSMGQLNDMQKQFMDVIKTNVRRMEALLYDVSYVNKLRKKTLQLNPKMDMFKNIAMRLEKDMKPLADELKRELIFEVPDGLPILNTDSELFVVALEKLIENAIRYTKEEGKITVSGSKDGANLLVKIADNGIGMSDEDKAKLGTIYFRSDDDHVREFKGSGLGIPIAYGMFDLLGASYTVETEFAKGTTFTVSIKGMV